MKLFLTVIILTQTTISSKFIDLNTISPENLIKDYEEDHEKYEDASVHLISNIGELNKIDDYGDCRFSTLNNILSIKRKNRLEPLEFEDSSEFCSQIQNSCCSKKEIEIMARKIYRNIPRTRFLFQRMNTALMTIKNNGDHILDFLKENNYKDSDGKCTMVSNRDIYTTFLNFLDGFGDKSMMINRYVDELIDFQSGFICSMCDQKFNHLFFVRRKGRKVMNWGQCSLLFGNHFFFLNVALNIYKIASIIKTIECSFKTPSKIDVKVDFQVLIDRYVTTSRCFDLHDIPGDSNNVECLLLCQTLSRVNTFDDSDGLALFNLTEYIFKFYDLYIKDNMANENIFEEFRKGNGLKKNQGNVENGENVENKGNLENKEIKKNKRNLQNKNEDLEKDEKLGQKMIDNEKNNGLKKINIYYQIYNSKKFIAPKNTVFYVDKYDGLYPSYYKMDFSSLEDEGDSKEFVSICGKIFFVCFLGLFL